MNPTAKNRVRLWWHCLIHFHKMSWWKLHGKLTRIECWTCGYGNDD